eukprot:comp22363_c1_seq1/m.33326 comp22363_c1_seq1/g.33326  ORF comp22363_c1_seq1/g.33326 comp22363_c1_seq1/m.33326 type:complete len:468 (-) comp22363_c1_seq1:237-1640(-)
MFPRWGYVGVLLLSLLQSYSVCVCALRLEAALPNDQAGESLSPASPATVYTVSVRDFGAKGNGRAYDTEAFRQAVAAVSAVGGGRINVPPGSYLVTTITLASNVRLHLEAGSTLISSNKTQDWAKPTVSYNVTRMCGGVWDKPYLGGPVIFCFQCVNVSVTGEGIIDGQGYKWWAMTESKMVGRRGYLLLMVNCTNVHVQGVTFQNSPSWNVVPKFCKNVTIENVLILNDYVQSHNTDGINPYGCDGVIIRDSILVTGDDCIAIKSGPRPSCGIPSQNILVHNVTCIGSHGLTIGSEMNAGVRNVVFSNITIDGRNTKSSQGVRLKSQRGRGGFVENILYENIRIHNVKIGIQATLNYREVDPSVKPTPNFRNITIRNVFATSVRRQLGSIDGLAEAPIDGIVLENVFLFGEEKVKPLKCKDAIGVSLTNVFPRPHMDASCGPQEFSLFDMLTFGMPKWVHLPHWFW